MYRDLDYAMLRRLEKRILVSLPNESARVAMFKHHLPSLLTNDPVTINCDVEYDRVAQVCTLALCVCASSSSLSLSLSPSSLSLFPPVNRRLLRV